MAYFGTGCFPFPAPPEMNLRILRPHKQFKIIIGLMSMWAGKICKMTFG
jgi:hypothetical protein